MDNTSGRLYVLDESSLASTKQMHTFLARLQSDDRVLLVGDARQHEAVDARRPITSSRRRGSVRLILTRLYGGKILS
jgi:ATP-dependent exoDNAse (exonuclease V) alpha subunit